MTETSAADVAAAETTIAKGSKSFAAAARLFAPAMRADAVLLYAWCRHCDDVIDGQELGFPAKPGVAGGAGTDLPRHRPGSRHSGARRRPRSPGPPPIRCSAPSVP